MPAEYKMLYRGGEGGIIEKKSRFIATTAPAGTEEEALEFIEAMRKKYWDASHNCFAYVIGEHAQLQRCSDDGEPGGTAGRPMLDVLLGEDVHNIVVVVTRYFGGTLLGTGGLVRAYSAAVQSGLAASIIITKIPGIKLCITADYASLGKIQYILGRQKIPIQNSVYTDKVELEILLSDKESESVKTALTEGTNAKASLKELGKCWFALIEGTPTILV